MIIRDIKAVTTTAETQAFIVELEVWDPEESDTIYFIDMAHVWGTDHFYAAEETVFEKVSGLWSEMDHGEVFDKLRADVENHITQDFTIDVGMFDLDYNDTPFPGEMELCIGLYEKYKADGSIDFSALKGKIVEDTMKQLIPREDEKRMWESELMNTIRETTEKISYQIQKAAWHDYRELKIKINSYGDIEVLDENEIIVFEREGENE